MPRQLPIHRHDCDGCRFLGSFDGKDVWSCDDIDLIIRYGSQDEENKAFPISVVRSLKRDMTRENVADWVRALSLYDYRQYPSYWRDLKHMMGEVV